MSLYTVSINGIIYAEHLPMNEATYIADDFREDGQDVKIQKEDDKNEIDNSSMMCCPICGSPTQTNKRLPWKGYYKRYRQCKANKFHPIFTTVEIPMGKYKEYVKLKEEAKDV